jgi:2-succinyl-5-enolpyruvyl-6-hydroxy-3-cyclohexene-1-carboxylate synthase
VADVTSGLRLGPVAEAVRAVHVHALLKSERFRTDHAPDAVLHLGGRTVSKQLRLFLRETRPDPFAVVRPDPSRIDPDHLVTHHVESGVAAFGAALLDRLPKETAGTPAWAESWRRASAAAGAAIRDEIEAVSGEADRLVEPAVAHLVARDVPADHALVLASSMPIRDVQRYAPGRAEAVPVVANRGASGIDGTVATAAGVALGRDAPATLLIGDLASLHDLSSLALLRRAPVVAVVVNNEGGGIFHFLPIAEHDDVFEDFFATPHPASFTSAAGVYDVAYHRATTAAELCETYAEACRSGASALIEVRTDRHDNPGVHDRLDEAAARRVGEVREEGRR